MQYCILSSISSLLAPIQRKINRFDSLGDCVRPVVTTSRDNQDEY